MNEINILTEYLSTRAVCALHPHSQAPPAHDVYVVEFSEPPAQLTYPICKECQDYILNHSTPTAQWVPIFCTKCGSGGWVERTPALQIEGSAVFSHGCPGCSTKSERLWSI